jgi:uncharacterized protein YfaS (alpha-2-macroglobulin family)
LAGLDPEAVRALFDMSGESEKMRNLTVRDLMNREDSREQQEMAARATEQARQDAIEAAMLKRQQKLEDDEASFGRDIAKETFKQHLSDTSLDTQSKMGLRNAQRQQALAMTEQIGKDKNIDPLKLSEHTFKVLSTINNEDAPFELRQAFAEQQNNSPISPYYYVVNPGGPARSFTSPSTWIKKAPSIDTVPLPINPATRKQLTAADVHDTIEYYRRERGEEKTVEDILIGWGVMPNPEEEE